MLHAELNLVEGDRYFFKTKYEGSFEAVVEFYSEPMGAIELSILDYENSVMEEPRTFFLDEIEAIYDEEGNTIYGKELNQMKSVVQVGFDMLKESVARNALKKLEAMHKREKRLGRYEIVSDENGVYKIHHILEGEEIKIMRERCKEEGHHIHVNGYCVKCHLQVE